MGNNIVLVKSKAFALRIIKSFRYLTEEKREFVLSKQLIRSGTSVGANIREAVRGQTKPDFYAKMNIALKEAEESAYWLELLYESDYINRKMFNSINSDCNEIITLLTAITKTQKSRNKRVNINEK